jgi:hypothetical protein
MEMQPGKLLSLFQTRTDTRTNEKGTPLESCLNPFQTL